MTLEYSHLVPVINVSDIQASLEFYQNQLKWNVSFTWGDPIEYAAVRYGDQIQLHLTQADQEIHAGHLILRIFVPDVRILYERMLQEGVTIEEPLHREPYGMMEFSIKDPDGYRLVLGTGEELLNL